MRHTLLPRWFSRGAYLAMGLTIVPIATAQNVPPPPPEPAPFSPNANLGPANGNPNARASLPQPLPNNDLGSMLQQFADAARRLGEDAATDLAGVPEGPSNANQAQELAQTAEEYRQGLVNQPGGFQVRKGYSNLHSSWQYLRSRLARPGASTAIVDRDAANVDMIDARITQSLGLNPLPADYYGNGPAPVGVAQTRRLARSLVDRSEALAQAIQNEMGNDGLLVQDANALVREADAWHDGLVVNTSPEAVARSFNPVSVMLDRVSTQMTTRALPAGVAQAWQGFSPVSNLVYQNLGIQRQVANGPAAINPGPNVTYAPGVDVTNQGVNIAVPGFQMNIGRPLVPTSVVVPNGPSIPYLADQLVQQTEAFLAVYGPTARVVPAGLLMLNDAQELNAAATGFRQNLAQGLDPNRLANEFRTVDAVWGRLARRVNRIAKGRTGPNIQQVQKIGATCDQIHQLLGMPGYPPVLTPY